MKVRLETIQYGNKPLTVAVCEENNRYVPFRSVEEYLGYSYDSARYKLKSKFIQRVLGYYPQIIDGVNLSSKINLNKVSLISFKDFESIVLIEKTKKKKVTSTQVIYTYFITDKDRGVVKIGKSCNPIKRLTGIQTAYPFPLALETVINQNLERYFHSLFEDFRLEGEWFDISCLQMVDIPSYMVK